MARIYQPSQLRRVRATNAEMAERRQALYEIVAEQEPMTAYIPFEHVR